MTASNPHPVTSIDEASGQLVENPLWQAWEAGYKAGIIALALGQEGIIISVRLGETCSSCGQLRSAPRLAGCLKGEHY